VQVSVNNALLDGIRIRDRSQFILAIALHAIGSDGAVQD
jgi:hypothetical protein